MIRILLFLFICATLISQTAMDFFATLLSFVLLWMSYKWKIQNSSYSAFNKTGFDWIFPTFFGVVLLGFLFNWNPDSNWLERLLEFKWIIFFYLITAAIIYVNPTDSAVKLISAVLIFCSLYAVVIYFLEIDPIKNQPLDSLPAPGGYRTGGFLSHPMVFAHCYALFDCVMIGLLFHFMRWRDGKAIWLFAAVLFTSLAVLFSFTRGVWISLSVATLVMAFLYSRRVGVLVLLGLVSISTALFYSWPSLRERALNPFKENSYDVERVYIWKANLEIFKDYPLLGVGYGENSRVLPEYYKKINAPDNLIVSHAHNQYLNFLAGTGILGLTAYLLMSLMFVVLSLKTLFSISDRNPFHKGLALGVIGAQISLHVGSLTESNFEHSKVKYIIALVWGIIVWLAYEHRVLRKEL